MKVNEIILWIALLVSGLIFQSTATAAETIDLRDFRHHKFLSQFTGSYISHDQSHRERISSIWIDEFGLHMWELGGFPVFVWHSFTFPVDAKPKLEEVRGTGVRRIGGPSKRKKYFVHTEYSFENDNSLVTRVTETDADDLHKSIEERRLVTDGTTLHYLFERKYFKKKYVFFGPWVEEVNSEVVRRSARSHVFTYVKQAPQPIPFELLKELARKRDRRLNEAFGNPSQIVADFGWDGYSTVEEIKEALKEAESAAQENSAEVIPFKVKCTKLLDPKT
jgi:hypothetical protein